jgi:hypothetical protein
MLEFLLEIYFVKPLFYFRKDKIDTTTEISTVMPVFTHTFCPIAPNYAHKKSQEFPGSVGMSLYIATRYAYRIPYGNSSWRTLNF